MYLLSVIGVIALKDIFNADERGLFYRALPTQSLAVNGEEAKGGRSVGKGSL